MNWKETLNPYMSTGEATFYRRFLHILKHFLIVIVGGAFFTRIVSHSFLFDHLYNPDIICAILHLHPDRQRQTLVTPRRYLR